MWLTVIMVVMVMVMVVHYPHLTSFTLSFLALDLFCPVQWSIPLCRSFDAQLNCGISSGLEALLCQCQWL